jgi:hypothetical protein
MLTDEDLRKEYDCARSASCRNAKAKRERQETEPTPKTKAEREREERAAYEKVLNDLTSKVPTITSEYSAGLLTQGVPGVPRDPPWHPFEDPLGPLQIGKAP